MNNLEKFQDKWQKLWNKDKVFFTEVDKREKYYIAIVYPYMNGYIHLGHLFTYMTSEILGRYKRMQNKNVLVKFGFHCTGTPIVAAAQRIKEGEKTQTETLLKMGISKKEISKFSDAEYWCNYFPDETIKDLQALGFALDYRYTFKTTYLDKPYDKFISWQFNKLKELGYVKKGKHPVVWCPKDNVPVGDHDRSEGEGETPQEYLLFKHKLSDNKYILTATLRPDTVLGVTNLFIHPDVEYLEVNSGKETWILAEKSFERLKQQGYNLTIKGKIMGKDLIGKKTIEFDGSKVLILPATFIDPDFGTGIVHSVPSDSADDLIALRDLQKDKKKIKKYNLDENEILEIKPIPVLNTPEFGNIAAEFLVKKYKVNNQNERKKLDDIKKELYKVSHYTATFNEKYKKIFSKNLNGKKVEEGKSIIKDDLVKAKFAFPYYELTGKVVCRCLTPSIVTLVSNQWFLEYNDPKWKKLAHNALNSMTIYPEKLRKQFDYVIDWLNHWACTREFGLGTKLPWDDKWVIESLSDSTIQMAYCTIAKYLENPKSYGFTIDNLNDDFFDYVFQGKGKLNEIQKSTGIDKKMIETMHKDFMYWYPFDFRNSAKDLLQNHLTFSIFNHTALFPKKQWPKSFLINGRIMVDNEKMSKQKGNFFTARELLEKYSADSVRLTAAYAGEGSDDANFDMKFLETSTHKLDELFSFVKENYGKGRDDKIEIDNWFENVINNLINDTTQHMENMMFKSAIQTGFMDMQRHLKWYKRRTGQVYNKDVINHFIEIQIKLLAPFTPHICEEMWNLVKSKGYVSLSSWPKIKKDIKLDDLQSEILISNILSDIQSVLKLAKIEKPKEIKLIIAKDWKYQFMDKLRKTLENTRNFKEILSKVMVGDLKQYGKDITKILPKYIKAGQVTELLHKNKEIDIISSSLVFFSTEFNNAKLLVEVAEKSKEVKANQAMPNKPAIIVK